MPRGIRRSTEAVQAQVEQPASVLEQPVISPRAAEMRRERRRRNDGDLDRMASQKLAIPQDVKEQLAREGKVARWILDTRHAEVHADDWDRVEGVAPVQANPREGTAEQLMLYAKYADWDAEDRKRDASVIDEREEQLIHGQVQGDGGSSAGLHVPKGQVNRISRQQGL